MRTGRACLDEWPLDPDTVYLNHGTVGVTPLAVLAEQRRIRDEAERAPSQVVLRRQAGLVGASAGHPSDVRLAAAEVAWFFGARADDFVFVDNVTSGLNSVLHALRLEAGDEVLITDHAYGAVVNAARWIAGRRGAVVRTAKVPYPQFKPKALVDAIASKITERTRIAILDHITAESALVMPVADIVAVCRARGVPVCIDGAHAPGVLPLVIPSLGVDWYVGNLHKWACAPRACGFLWASERGQVDLHPAVISWGLGKGMTAEFDWVGTKDYSAWLAAPAGLVYLRERGLREAWTYNHGLAWHGARLLAQAWGTELPVQEDSIGFMATVPVPLELGTTAQEAAVLRDALLAEHRIEVQVHAAYGRVWVRLSAQAYNELDDVRRLAEAVLISARRQVRVASADPGGPHRG